MTHPFYYSDLVNGCLVPFLKFVVFYVFYLEKFGVDVRCFEWPLLSDYFIKSGVLGMKLDKTQLANPISLNAKKKNLMKNKFLTLYYFFALDRKIVFRFAVLGCILLLFCILYIFFLENWLNFFFYSINHTLTLMQ